MRRFNRFNYLFLGVQKVSTWSILSSLVTRGWCALQSLRQSPESDPICRVLARPPTLSTHIPQSPFHLLSSPGPKPIVPESTLFNENTINLTCCTIIKMPALRIDKCCAGRTKCLSNLSCGHDDRFLT